MLEPYAHQTNRGSTRRANRAASLTGPTLSAVRAPRQTDTVMNLKTAQAIGLSFPVQLLRGLQRSSTSDATEPRLHRAAMTTVAPAEAERSL
jgi:hypothetical protein